jgi:hypothetical protein
MMVQIHLRRDVRSARSGSSMCSAAGQRQRLNGHLPTANLVATRAAFSLKCEDGSVWRRRPWVRSLFVVHWDGLADESCPVLVITVEEILDPTFQVMPETVYRIVAV